MLLVKLDSMSVSINNVLNIELPLNFITTTVAYIQDTGVIALGSRAGALALYDTAIIKQGISSQTLGFINCYRSLNEKYAITSILDICTLKLHTTREKNIRNFFQVSELPCVADNGILYHSYILTTGRNGKYSFHLILVKRNGALLEVDP